MKQFNISNFSYSNYDLANLFNVYQDEDSNYYFSINRTIYFVGTSSMIPSMYNTYTVQEGDTWTKISYITYGTIDLWWLVCKSNNIIDPTSHPESGTTIKLLTTQIANSVIESIKTA